MLSLDRFAQQKLSEIAQKHLLRELKTTAPTEGTHVIRNGKPCLSFSSNDYFGLSQHPTVKKAAIEAINTYGTGAGASRMVTGNHPLYSALETKLAHAKQKDASLVFGSGYMANLGAITALVGKGDVVIADKLVHACMIDGAQLSGARLLRFSHNNIDACRKLLQTHRQNYRHCLILTETVFSMDGDFAPIENLAALSVEYDSWLLADDAHGLGIAPSIKSPSLVYTGTLSKGLGSYGGYIAAAKSVIDYFANTARSFIFTTGLPPSAIAAATAALELITNIPSLPQQALSNAKYFSQLMKLPEAQSPIVPLVTGSPEKTMQLSQALEERGFLVSAIRPPTVPRGTSRLRFTFSSLHGKSDIEDVVKQLRQCDVWN